MKTVIVIPARFASKRLPGKPLLDIGGEPMIVKVWKRCLQVAEADRVVVATDDERIRDAVDAVGGEAVMTSPEHRSGTDRIAEAAASMACDLVVNVQGDEPFIDPSSLDALIASFAADDGIGAATLASPVRDREELFDPAVVKVVTNRRGEAVYFSRYPVPYWDGLWEVTADGWKPGSLHREGEKAGRWLRHVGTYAYRKEFLERYRKWSPGDAEELESLEQLRILEEGERIRVVTVAAASKGVDTPSDLARARETAGA